MSVKPVLEIEINDEAFRSFYKLFNEYSETLKSQPGAWEALRSSMGSSTKELSEGALGAKDALALAAAQAGIISEALRDSIRAQRDLGTVTQASGKHMSGLAKSAQGVAHAISEVAGWIIKIGAIGGLGALFGGFGIGDLAGAAFDRSRSAGRMGVSPGALASFQVNAQQFLSPSALEAAADAQADIGKASAISTLFGRGGYKSAEAMSSTQFAFEALKKAADAYSRTAPNLRMVNPAVRAYMALGGNMGDIRNAALHRGELSDAERATLGGASAFGFDRKTEAAWNALKITFDRAKMTIETSLIKALGPLAPEIGTLATEISGFIATFLNSKNFGIVVNDVRDGLHAMGDFLRQVDWKKIGSEIQWVADKLGWMIPKDDGSKPHKDKNFMDAFWNNDDWADLGAKGVKSGLGAIGNWLNAPQKTDVEKNWGKLGNLWEFGAKMFAGKAVYGVGPYTGDVERDMSHAYQSGKNGRGTGSTPGLIAALAVAAKAAGPLGLYAMTSGGHSIGSKHYLGKAADIDYINGKLVGSDFNSDAGSAKKMLDSDAFIRLGVGAQVLSILKSEGYGARIFQDNADHIHLETSKVLDRIASRQDSHHLAKAIRSAVGRRTAKAAVVTIRNHTAGRVSVNANAIKTQ